MKIAMRSPTGRHIHAGRSFAIPIATVFEASWVPVLACTETQYAIEIPLIQKKCL
jgi:hypothetical protein